MPNDSSSATAILLTNRLHPHSHSTHLPPLILSLTADERTRSRYSFITEDNTLVHLQLPRGTTLQQGDILTSETGEILVQVRAKPEQVLTLTSDDKLQLLRAAYHLGNRHVSLEISPNYLRLSPDPVLEKMSIQLGLQVVTEVAPFCPEGGAYSHHHE
ncbi:urease accessory protein UreE [Chamaesiphon sp. OTE_75_metabat_556]|uniref:urease accessory protein UreE n=1 Tax=Chamaesiphon sp. OTE_75_metabat_556 TaxID=2964692 RepID=UPI00286AE82E|nr:urease accessory protein UreE [Chamaesiphon sp. OTE_75_metabat_556]